MTVSFDFEFCWRVLVNLKHCMRLNDKIIFFLI